MNELYKCLYSVIRVHVTMTDCVMILQLSPVEQLTDVSKWSVGRTVPIKYFTKNWRGRNRNRSLLYLWKDYHYQ